MNQIKEIWVRAEVALLFSQALKIAENDSWHKTERSKAYATINTGKALIPNLPDLIEWSFQDFLRKSVELYYDRHVAPDVFRNSTRTPAQAESFYESDPLEGGYATPHSPQMA